MSLMTVARAVFPVYTAPHLVPLNDPLSLTQLASLARRGWSRPALTRRCVMLEGPSLALACFACNPNPGLSPDLKCFQY